MEKEHIAARSANCNCPRHQVSIRKYIRITDAMSQPKNGVGSPRAYKTWNDFLIHKPRTILILVMVMVLVIMMVIVMVMVTVAQRDPRVWVTFALQGWGPSGPRGWVTFASRMVGPNVTHVGGSVLLCKDGGPSDPT